MYDYHVVFGALGVLFGFIGYIPYFRDIFRGTTKPHPFSWFLWSILDTTACVVQLVEGAGPGAWILGLSGFVNLIIAVLALSRGEKRIHIFDWICLALALGGIVLWQITNDPLAAVILVTITDALAFIPTYRKGYLRPNEETVAEFAFATLKFGLGLLALRVFNFATVLYLAYLVVSNGGFALMVLLRRRQLGRVS